MQVEGAWSGIVCDALCCAVAFLDEVIESVKEAKHARPDQPLLFLQMHRAQYLLVIGDLKQCKTAVEEGKQTLDSLDDVSPPFVPCAEPEASQ